MIGSVLFTDVSPFRTPLDVVQHILYWGEVILPQIADFINLGWLESKGA
jgi:hypothetical protein